MEGFDIRLEEYIRYRRSVESMTANLRQGETYTLSFEHREGKEVVIHRKRMRLLKKYRYYALMENALGMRECFKYDTLQKMLYTKSPN